MDLIADLLAMGASQSHVARILNVTPASVSLWRRGERTPCRDLTAWDTTDTEQGAG